MAFSYRHAAGFGKRIEHWVVGKMLKEGLDVYLPLVDDDGIDAVVRRKDGTFVEIQIKARSSSVTAGDAALFAAISHEKRINYFFIFYAERLDKTWILTSEEFIRESYQNKKGKNKGRRSIWFNGRKKGEEYAYPRFDKYLVTNFDKLKSPQ